MCKHMVILVSIVPSDDLACLKNAVSNNVDHFVRASMWYDEYATTF